MPVPFWFWVYLRSLLSGGVTSFCSLGGERTEGGGSYIGTVEKSRYSSLMPVGEYK